MLTLKYQDEPHPCQKMIQGAVYWLKGGDVKKTQAQSGRGLVLNDEIAAQ